MQLSKETVVVLKNFAEINQNLWIDVGNMVHTKAPSSNIYARAELKETFEREFGIYNLGQIVGILGMIDAPQFEVDETSITIGDEKVESVRQPHATKNVLTIPERALNLDVKRAESVIKVLEGTLNKIRSVGKTLNLPHVRFYANDDNQLMAEVFDNGNSSTTRYGMLIGDTVPEGFSYLLKLENLRLIPGPYEIRFYPKAGKFPAAVEFVLLADEMKVTYIVACEIVKTGVPTKVEEAADED